MNRLNKNCIALGKSGVEHTFDYILHSSTGEIAVDYAGKNVLSAVIKMAIKSHDVGILNRIVIVDDNAIIDSEAIRIARDCNIKILRYSEFVEKYLKVGNG